MVVLTRLPVGLVDGLPEEDRQAIRAIVGKPVLLSEYDDLGRAELEFVDEGGVVHYLYVDVEVIGCAEKGG